MSPPSFVSTESYQRKSGHGFETSEAECPNGAQDLFSFKTNHFIHTLVWGVSQPHRPQVARETNRSSPRARIQGMLTNIGNRRHPCRSGRQEGDSDMDNDDPLTPISSIGVGPFQYVAAIAPLQTEARSCSLIGGLRFLPLEVHQSWLFASTMRGGGSDLAGKRQYSQQAGTSSSLFPWQCLARNAGGRTSSCPTLPIYIYI